jgi:hypothetical protein
MMRDLYLGVTLPFGSEAEQKHSEDILMWLLGTVCRLNLHYLTRHPDTPLLYDSGVRYSPPDQTSAPTIDKAKLRQLFELLQAMGLSPEVGKMVFRIVRGAEVFLDIPNLYLRKKGDCNELVPVRVAELWRAGIIASPYLIRPAVNKLGGLTYHAVVLHEDGSHEDPSLILGMGGKARAAERAEEIRKNHERFGNYIAQAKRLIAAGAANADEVGREIDMMGLVPRDGFCA